MPNSLNAWLDRGEPLQKFLDPAAAAQYPVCFGTDRTVAALSRAVRSIRSQSRIHTRRDT
jgi:hypothetical protein